MAKTDAETLSEEISELLIEKNLFVQSLAQQRGDVIRLVIFALSREIAHNKSIQLNEEYISEISKELSEERETPKRFGLALKPSCREGFEKVASDGDMTLTEFIRRAGFAAQVDPSILFSPEVELLESAYREGLGPSRWATRDNE